jgi:hypothetical protein
LTVLLALDAMAWQPVVDLHQAQRRAQRRRHPVLKVQAALLTTGSRLVHSPRRIWYSPQCRGEQKKMTLPFS